MFAEIKKVINEYKNFLLERKVEIESSDERVLSESLDDIESVGSTADSVESSEKENEEYEYIVAQMDMLENCYNPETQEMSIFEDTGYPYYLENTDNQLLYELEKFFYQMGAIAKKGVRKLLISQECPSHNHLWDFIKNNQDLSELVVDCEFFSGKFLESDSFYRALRTAPNLYIINVFVGEDEETPDMEVVKDQLIAKMPERPFIFSWGCLGIRTTLIKKANSNEVFCASNDDNAWSNERAESDEDISEDDEDVSEDNELTEQLCVRSGLFDNEQFKQKLSEKESFGLPLLFQALDNKIIGEFDDDMRDLVDLTINLEQEYDDWRLLDYALLHDDVLVTRFLMREAMDLSSANSLGERPLEIAAKHASVAVLRALLELNFSEAYLSSGKLLLLRLENAERQIPIMIAANNGRIGVVKFFLEHDISLGQYPELQKKIMDIVWNKQYFEIMHYLLQQDFPFPENFELSQINPLLEDGEKLIAFVAKRQSFHDQIEQGELNLISNDIISGEQAGRSLNMKNSSALFTAFFNQQYNIYAYLKTKGFKSNESEGLESLVGMLREKEQNTLNKALVLCFNKPWNASVFYLLSRSRIMQKDSFYFEIIRSIYEQLTTIPMIAPFLSVIEHYKGIIDIVFDFEHVNTLDLDVTSYKSTEGRCRYDEGRIFIAAKLEHHELLGNIAHEITHLAIQILYKNACKPYGVDEDASNYIKIKEACAQLDFSMLDKIISLAFTAYGQVDWDAELIVRVPHILAKYGNEFGLALLQKQVPDLLNYCNQVVIPACNSFITKSVNLNAERQLMESRKGIHNHSLSFFETMPSKEEVCVSVDLIEQGLGSTCTST